MDKLERRTAVNIGLAILLLGFVAGAAREAPQRQAGIRLAFQLITKKTAHEASRMACLHTTSLSDP